MLPLAFQLSLPGIGALKNPVPIDVIINLDQFTVPGCLVESRIMDAIAVLAMHALLNRATTFYI